MNPWERQERETEKAFEAFRTYRDLGVGKSTAKVAQVLGKTKCLIDRWSSRWNWVERIVAYQSYLEELAQKARDQETIKQARKIISKNEVLEELTQIAECDWREFIEIKFGKDGETLNANLKLSDKLKALELAGKYHKLFTEKVEHSFNLKELAKETYQELIDPRGEFKLDPDSALSTIRARFGEISDSDLVSQTAN